MVPLTIAPLLCLSSGLKWNTKQNVVGVTREVRRHGNAERGRGTLLPGLQVVSRDVLLKNVIFTLTTDSPTPALGHERCWPTRYQPLCSDYGGACPSQSAPLAQHLCPWPKPSWSPRVKAEATVQRAITITHMLCQSALSGRVSGISLTYGVPGMLICLAPCDV